MNFPKLKNALFCRILTYIVVVGGFMAPVAVIAVIKPIPDIVKSLSFIPFDVLLVIYIFKNFGVLMFLDMCLAGIRCYNTAGKLFRLPKRRSQKSMERRIRRFGKGYEPAPIKPRPLALRYKLSTSFFIYSKGTEKVLASYRSDFLDKDSYRDIIQSAAYNSKALTGKRKPILLDKQQKKAALNRVTVIFIFASRVDAVFKADLYDTVCNNEGDGFETAFLPCVIDIEDRSCVFSSIRFPYLGYGYPVRNRGIRAIRRCVFGGRLPAADDKYKLAPFRDIDQNQSLWQFWRSLIKEFILERKASKKRFEAMTHRQIVFEDDFLYIKWDKYGLWLAVEYDVDGMTVIIDPIHSWSYPKQNLIAKKTINELKAITANYFRTLGYSVKFLPYEE